MNYICILNKGFMPVVSRYLLISLFIFTSPVIFSQPDSYRKTASMLVAMLDKYHYSPLDLNDEFSSRVYNGVLESVDPYGLLFTQKEIKELSEFEFRIDDEIVNGPMKFPAAMEKIFSSCVHRADSIAGGILSKPFDFKKKEVLVLKDSVVYCENVQELSHRWEQWLKMKTLNLLFSAEPETGEIPGIDKELLAREPEARAKVLARHQKIIQRRLSEKTGGIRYISGIYLSSIAKSYDPHSDFFSQDEQNEFESHLSASNLSFGIEFDENDNEEIILGRIVPGGPAWKSNELHTGDLLLGIAWNGGENIDLTSYTAWQLEDFLETSEKMEIEITVRNAEKMVKTVVLRKEKLEVEENIVTGYVLDGEKKIGYISLPSFYTEWEENNRLGCANDVAKEILKLKRENIDGLILDLRFNGGGSVGEAFELAGIFIDEGPMGVYRYRDEKPGLFKDANRGTIFDGPLVVMINGASASASEILAATFQDYNRALIVGNNSFGKSTAQVVLPVDTNLINYNPKAKKSLPPTSFAKVTIEKIYRVTGASAQWYGVIPDIKLPDLLEYYDYREQHYAYSLPNDSVNKIVYYKPLPELPGAELSGKSKVRIQNDSLFMKIISLRDSLTSYYKGDTHIPLEINAYRDYSVQREKMSEEMDDLLFRETNIFKARNNQFDSELLKMDVYKKEFEEEILKQLNEDIYLSETYQVILDYINSQK